MGKRSAHLEDPETIRMVFQRACREGRSLRLRFGNFQQDFSLLAEEEDRLIVALPGITRGQWDLKPGCHLALFLEDRGRAFEAVVEFGGHGELNGVPCAHVSQPRILKCLNDSQLSDFVPEMPLRCTYTTRSLDIRDGFLRALGREGVELSLAPGRQAEPIRLGGETMLELFLDRDLRVVAPARFEHLGDGYAGLRFTLPGDAPFFQAYLPWLEAAQRAQGLRDRQAFDPKGAQGSQRDEQGESRPGSRITMHSDRDPLILVISAGEDFPARVAQSLGRRFGVASLDHVQGPVKSLLGPPLTPPEGGAGEDWGRLKLLLIHQRLRIGSGLELTRQLIQQEHCPIPILVAGTEEDVALKRNRAIAAGAVDFISVDPFHVLSVMKAVGDTLAMFA